MALIVQKYGGSSVADASRLRLAAERIVNTRRAGNDVVVVVSARGDKTDELIELAGEISEAPPPREMDMLLATGEQESVALLAMAVHTLGEPVISFTGYQIGIFTDSSFTKARIRRIDTERIRNALREGRIVIAAGFQGIDDDFNITTLGRGGSDTTATALAAVLQADVCEIYTDVDGIYTTDPRIVKRARRLERIAYDEMLELTSLGGGKMHSRSIEFAKKYRVPLLVRPAYMEGAGTLIAPVADSATLPVVSGVALVKSEAIVNLRGLPDRPGVLATLFAEMSRRKIAIDMVVQDVATAGLAEVSFTVPESDLAEALTAAEAAVAKLGAGTVQHGTNVAKVSVVGAGMRTHTGVAAQMFQSLSEAGVNTLMITTSEIKISVLVNREQSVAALNAAHDGFSLHDAVTQPLAVGYQNIPTDAAPVSRDELERDVVSRLASMEDIVVSEVQLDEGQSRITIRGIANRPGVAAEVFAAVGEGGVMVDMIVQNIGLEGRTDISFTVPRSDLERCLLLVRELGEHWEGAQVSFEREIALLSVIGIGLRSHTGVGERMFAALGAADVNVDMVNTSEIRVSAVVSPTTAKSAHAALLKEFGLTEVG